MRPLMDADPRAPRALVVRRHQLTAKCIQDKTRLDSVSTAMQHHTRAHPGLAESELEHSNRKRQDRLCNDPSWRGQTELLRRVPGVVPWCLGAYRRTARTGGISKLHRSVGAPEPGQQSATRASPCLGGRATARTILYIATVPATQGDCI